MKHCACGCCPTNRSPRTSFRVSARPDASLSLLTVAEMPRKEFALKKYITLIIILLLAAAVLSSCYIAPDDINDGNDGLNKVNNLPFNTMVPTATVTPEDTQQVVVVQTQNIFGPAATPTDSAPVVTTPPVNPDVTPQINQWGVIATTNSGAISQTTPAMPTANANGVIVLVTPLPQGVTPTPGAVPQVTQNVQVPVDVPVVTSPPTKAPVTNTPEPASVQIGFNGQEVRNIQKRLKELGYYTGSVDGDFGTATDKAVKAFQKANGLTADGKIGPKTMEALNSSKAVRAGTTATPKTTAKRTATPKPTKKVTPTPRPTATPNLSKDYYLQSGSSGAKVRTLQNRLIELGWLQGKATGDYDAATETAVKAFQKKAGIWNDGVAGPDTLRILYSSSAPKTSNAASSTGATLEMGSEGSAVRALQDRLKKLGYLKGTTDGSFGEATRNAVIAFQQNNGLTADGKAGNATLNLLYSDNARPAGSSSSSTSSPSGTGNSDIGSTGYVTLEAGSTGSSVKKLQQRLKELGYYSGSVDGSFGEGTEVAVETFQRKHNLRVDGKAGPATQRVLYGTSANLNYNTLELGSTGTTVRNLQYTLYELGFYDGPRDGVYGDTTADAVRAFQIRNKLTPVDGKAGNMTLQKLYSADAIPAAAPEDDYDTVRPGDRNDTVYQLRDCLVAMGYLETLNNTYDIDMVEAVKQFQKDNDLTVDGVCGPRTISLIFGY